MATVRISGNWRKIGEMEWAGAPNLDSKGRIERSLDIPEQAYQAIEQAIAHGHIEGSVPLHGGVRFQWFLDR